MNSCLIADVGHRQGFQEKWNPSDSPGWAQGHLYQEKTYKIMICFVGTFLEKLSGYPTATGCYKVHGFQICEIMFVYPTARNLWVPFLGNMAAVPNRGTSRSYGGPESGSVMSVP